MFKIPVMFLHDFAIIIAYPKHSSNKTVRLEWAREAHSRRKKERLMYYSNYNRSPDERDYIEAPSFRVHKEEPPKKKNHFAVKITAACLTCALVGGLAGGGIILAANGQRLAGSSTTIYDATHTPTVLNVSNITSDKQLTLSEVYAANVGSTVGITTELVTTNSWGQQVAGGAALSSPRTAILSPTTM